jgi:hypothetical protein
MALPIWCCRSPVLHSPPVSARLNQWLVSKGWRFHVNLGIRWRWMKPWSQRLLTLIYPVSGVSSEYRWYRLIYRCILDLLIKTLKHCLNSNFSYFSIGSLDFWDPEKNGPHLRTSPYHIDSPWQAMQPTGPPLQRPSWGDLTVVSGEC